MGRPTKEEELRRAKEWVAIARDILDSGEALIKLGTKEGLWVGLQLDLFLVSGEVHSEQPVLFAQREAVVNMLNVLKKLTLKDVPMISDINPLNVLYKLIEPIHAVLGAKVSEEGGPAQIEVPDLSIDLGDVTESFFSPFMALLKAKETIEGEPIKTKTVTLRSYYYMDIGMAQRILLALIAPGIFRILFELLSQGSMTKVI